ncbi:hypothetical protein HGP14_33615 [Rhizobium sp. P32RR-XVIII]|uniref:hypothetical protein n=1 Tax=Rhizobium sp. P32RR-XVIII TaxID=2726738 RepID=UPI00145766C4|nr:hypothetical protein [Rhizobium sp. P32RR-XVIII]NLS08135.1 hypothetical protein [Rhizobium sp. P32RR-XVIII]
MSNANRVKLLKDYRRLAQSKINQLQGNQELRERYLQRVAEFDAEIRALEHEH